VNVPIIPRKLLFGNPDRTLVRLSPDGEQIAWLAPRDGVLNVWVAPRQNFEAARPVTNDTGRGIRFFTWAYNNTHIFYIQDKGGDENWRLYSVDLNSDTVKDLTPYDEMQARIQQLSPDFPGEALVMLNNRDQQWHDLHRMDIHTGEMSLIFENNQFLDVITDDRFNLRGAVQMTPEGGMLLFRLLDGDWKEWDPIPAEDALTTNPVGFDKSGEYLFLKDSRERNTAALFEQNFETGKKKLLAEDSKADAEDVVQHPTQKHIQAVSFIYERKRWQILDPDIEADFAYLATVTDGDAEVISRTLDDHYWIVAYVVDDGAVRYYLYNREAREANFLFTNRPALDDQPLVKMHSVVIKNRDGLDMVVYYSLPVGSAFPAWRAMGARLLGI
jgi:dipeptidyl aminopeptidase/acylaminoacyl peptidase